MRKSDVDCLLSYVNESFEELEKEYNNSLECKEISCSLKIRIKNSCENIRSCLDYIASDVDEIVIRPYRKKNQQKLRDKIYFPYGNNKINFDQSVQRNLPELLIVDKRIYSLIESIQPYKCGNSWLYDLCNIVNTNKHDSLSPQTKQEQLSYKIEKPNTGLSISGPAGSIKGPPGSIKMGGIPINFDTKTGLPLEVDGLKRTIIKWVSFVFEGTNINVLNLIKTSLGEIQKFTERIYEILKV